ncbi:MAG TPA: hypothetical protein VMT46_16070, partial [Anaerolineaceae bacterium]|nr:hypothetical protein [Anaerolineaceae bacterium]
SVSGGIDQGGCTFKHISASNLILQPPLRFANSIFKKAISVKNDGLTNAKIVIRETNPATQCDCPCDIRV